MAFGKLGPGDLPVTKAQSRLRINEKEGIIKLSELKQNIGTAAGKCIRGWELANLDPDSFDLRAVEVFGECAECPFLKFCSTPSDSIRELIPKRGDLVELGRKEPEEGETDVCFGLILEEEIRFILLRDHKYYWLDASYISGEQVPPSMRGRGRALLPCCRRKHFVP